MYKNKRTRLGFLGIGIMGEPMVMRLLAADYEVNVWNRNRQKLANVAAAGAVPQDSAADVATASDIILLCLTDTDAVNSVVMEDPNFLAALNKQKLIIDLSSISPKRTREIATSIHEQCGASWIDSPVSGGVPGAEQGTLVAMAGGAIAAIERANPVLAVLTQRITHMGDSGAGQATKLANQVIVGCNIVAISEAIRLAESMEVDTKLLTQALAGGFADSLPLQVFGQRMADRQFQPVSIKMQLMLKDLQGAINTDPDNSLLLDMTNMAVTQLQNCADRLGQAECITRLIEPSGK